MPESLRIALVLDPFSIHLKDRLQLGVKWGNHAPQLARELLGRGHVVRGFGAPPGVVPRSGDALDSASGPASTWGPLGTLGSFAPDVLVAYDALSPAAVRAARGARSQGAGLVLVEAGTPGGRTFRDRFLGWLGDFLWGRLVRRRANAVVSLDTVARERALAEGFDPRLVSVVPHGEDVGLFRPGLTSTLVGRHRVRGRILLYVGRLQRSRGLEVLLSAFARTVGQRGDWTLVLAGEGPDRAHLRTMADRLGVAAHVHWLGRPRDEELPGLLGASTLFAAPHLDDTGNARQIVRAMACGLPVLVSDVPRLASFVSHDQTGLLTTPGDVEAWVETLRRAAGSPVSRQRWSQEARRVAVERFGWSAVATRFETILRAAHQRAQEEAAERHAGRSATRRAAKS